MKAAFSLGSNVGNRFRYLCQAKTLLLLCSKVKFIGQSSVYETEPVGVDERYISMKYLNAIVVVDSPYTSEQWLKRIKEIEHNLGRVRSGEINEPRTIDVDLIFCGDEVINSENLVVPHPRWAERRFVVEPLADVCSDVVLPGAECSVGQTLDRMPNNDEIKLFSKKW